MKKLLLTIAVVAAVVLGTVAVSKAATVISAIKLTNDSWNLVFGGKMTNTSGAIAISKKIEWVQLHALLWSGHDFKVSVKSAVGGGSGAETYVCSSVNLADGDNVFSCYGGSANDSENKHVLSLRFDSATSVYFISQVEGDTDGTKDIRIFAKR